MTGCADWTPQVPVLMFMSVIGDLSGLGSTTGTRQEGGGAAEHPRVEAGCFSPQSDLVWSGLV